MVMRNYGLVAITLAVGLASFSEGARAGNATTECAAKALLPESEKAFNLKRALAYKSDQFKFTPESRAFFAEQRSHLRNLVVDANRSLIELEPQTKRLIMAVMGEGNALLSGPGGGGKSQLLDLIYGTPQEFPDRATGPSLFSLQFNPQTGEYGFRGYMEGENWVNAGTIANSQYAVLEEIGAGSPMALAAALDVINERKIRHGTQIFKLPLKSTAATTNSTLYETIEQFAAQMMGPTGTAFLDRLPYKLHFQNFPIDEGKASNLIELGQKSYREKATMGLLRYSNQEEAVKKLAEMNFRKERDPVDFTWLGQIASAMVELDKRHHPFYAQIAAELRKKINGESMRVARELADSGGVGGEGYYPSQSTSSRTLFRHSVQTVALSVMYDLMMIPETVLPSNLLLDLLENGALQLSRESAWRLQDLYLTANSAMIPHLKIASDGGTDKLVLDYTNQMDALKNTAANPRDLALYTNYEKEMNLFKDIFNESYGQVTESDQDVANITASFPEIAEKLDLLFGKHGVKLPTGARNIEEFILKVNGGL